MSSEENTNIVPVDKVNIENAAAATGGFVGLMLTGPLGAVTLAALTSYVVKKDSDTGDALRLMPVVLCHDMPCYAMT